MRYSAGFLASTGFGSLCAAIAAVFLGLAAPAAADENLYFKFKDGGTRQFYAHSYALVVGIGDYLGNHPPLPGAERDARRVADALTGAGFDVTPYYQQTITGEKLRTLIADFVDRHGYEEDSRVLIWFAGHGFTIDGEGYLLGSDAPKLDAAAPGFNEELRTFFHASMPMRLFGVHLRQMRARHVMLVLDSCFSGSVFTNTRASGIGASNVEMYSPTRQIITSGTEGQEVSDQGRFAEMFVRAISGEAGENGRNADEDGDGYVSGTELGSFLYANARTDRQTPQFGRLPSVKINASQSDTLFMTAYADYQHGEFFFPLPGSLRTDHTEPEQPPNPVPVVRAPAVFWSGLAKGTRIANQTPDPIPVFRAPPPELGEKALDLEAGSFYPPAGREAQFEKAEIAGQAWLRFERDGSMFYVPAGTISIQRP